MEQLQLITAEIRPVPAWPGYFASSDGRIYSTRGWSRVMHELKPVPGGGDAAKYLYFTVSRGTNASQRKLGVHQAVALAFISKPEMAADVKLVVRHRDNNPRNNAATNLLWGTQKQNLADRYEHGTVPLGEANKSSKLTRDQVIQIRLRRAAGERCRDIAASIGVAYQTIHKVGAGKSWQHVSEPAAPRQRKSRTVTSASFVAPVE